MLKEVYWLGLKLIPELNNRLNRALECFGSPENIWKASIKELRGELGLSVDVAEGVIRQKNELCLDRELDKIRRAGVELLTISDPSYPGPLKEIHSPPPVLFIKGELIKSYEVAVAIVGSRKASSFGRTLASELAQNLSRCGITIVSGVARGIDSAAHRGALKEEGGTVGVLGCGLDIVYPPENKRLYLEIAERGSLISEQPLGMRALPQHFPARNRIISGLSLGVIVIEAPQKSGALITADFALEQGREVMAVPGNVKSSLSKGTHTLLKQGACLVESVDDVIEALNLNLKSIKGGISGKEELLSAQEKAVLTVLDWEPRHIDAIASEVGLTASQVASLLSVLEIKGFVKQDFGKRYLRI
ncbi:MAG TPA: DNA-protecting protein DprA [Actinobacteria bacterium]|nr:DNA-protecting protein DprA [Actinomycetota bacterium]